MPAENVEIEAVFEDDTTPTNPTIPSNPTAPTNPTAPEDPQKPEKYAVKVTSGDRSGYSF